MTLAGVPCPQQFAAPSPECRGRSSLLGVQMGNPVVTPLFFLRVGGWVNEAALGGPIPATTRANPTPLSSRKAVADPALPTN